MIAGSGAPDSPQPAGSQGEGRGVLGSQGRAALGGSLLLHARPAGSQAPPLLLGSLLPLASLGAEPPPPAGALLRAAPHSAEAADVPSDTLEGQRTALGEAVRVECQAISVYGACS